MKNKMTESHVVLIFEEQRSEIIIVTAVKVDDVRLKRYGFNRI